MSSANLTDRVAAQIAPLLPAHRSILVGLSGGVDSVVLLHLLHQLSPRFFWNLFAIHVHHGISPNADAWAEFCADLCASLNITLHVEHVDITPLRNEHGIEAAARKLRHAAFSQQSCDFVALAHHADDQVETLLLQLLRGAGVRGASAMPQFAEQLNLASLIRPLLNCSRQEILGYAAAHQLRWIEDESNLDVSYPRNFLRQRVLPILGERFPAYRDTLVRSTQHFAEAASLLDELAQQDAVQAIEGGTLSVQALQSISSARAKNLLRYFLHGEGAPMPQAVQLDGMLEQLCAARQDASVCVNFSDWQVRRYRGKVYVMRTLEAVEDYQAMVWGGETELEWPALRMPLSFKHTRGFGISLEKLQQAPVTLRYRKGGEALQVFQNAPTRTLKNLLQEHQIPPWQRDRLPLMYCGADLVCVPGVEIAAGYRAKVDEAGLVVELRGRIGR